MKQSRIVLCRAAALFWILFAASPVPAEARPKAPDWPVLTSHAGQFRIRMPGIPGTSHTVENSFLGKIHTDLYTLNVGDGEVFSAQYVRIPSAALFFVGAKSILKRSMKALLKDERGEEIRFADIPFDRGTGRELAYRALDKEDRPVLGTARFLILGKRLYILSVTAPPEKWDPERVETFLASFEVWEDEKEG